MRTSALRKNPGFSMGRVSKTRIFRLNEDNVNVEFLGRAFGLLNPLFAANSDSTNPNRKKRME